jgi:hypothetical protein
MSFRMGFALAGVSIAVVALLSSTASASPALPIGQPSPWGLTPQTDCLLQPHIPETPAYYIVWWCLTQGQVPEPIYALTGCTLGFPITNVHCPSPLPQNCIQVEPWSHLCEGDVDGFLRALAQQPVNGPALLA